MTKSSVFTVILLVIAAGISLTWLVHPYFDTETDASVYILTAQSLLAGEGYSYLGSPFTMRPPGFSILLTPVLALFGTDFRILNSCASLLGVLTVGLFFFYARARVGVLVGASVAVFLWLNPEYQRMSTQIMSDIPGTALLLGCLLVERWVRRKSTLRRNSILAICIAVASYVRTANTLLVPAIVAARLLRWKRGFAVRQTAVLAVLTLLLILPWGVRNATTRSTAVEQTANYSYGVALWHTDRGDPESPTVSLGEVAKRVPEQLDQILAMLGNRLSPKPDRVDRVIGGLILLLWLVSLIRRRESAEFFAAASLFVLVIYFTFVTRLLLPIYVLVIPAVIETILLPLERMWGRRIAQIITASLLVLLTVSNLDFRRNWSQLAKAHQNHLELAEYVKSEVPPDTPLAGYFGWDYSVYLGRPVYNCVFAMKRQGLQGAKDVIDRYDIGVVLLKGMPLRGTPKREFHAYLSQRYGVERRFGTLAVVRIAAKSEAIP